MDNPTRTREELIEELQDLQKAHNSLNATYESDLLAHKLTEDALRASEERFQLLFNKAPLGYQSLDFDGNFIEVNQQWLDTLGYEREDVIGKWFGDFLTPAFQDGFRNRFPVFKAQGHIHSEFEMVHKNGTVLFIAFDGRIGYDLNGEFKQTHCILQDITERKKAEQELKRIEWLLTSRPQVPEAQKQAYIAPYGDLVKLNTCRLILDSVGEPILNDIVSDYLNLLDTSSAIYEKNGDYALGIFSSGWCRFMDAASRAICDTDDNREALDCGLWHCHESCWTRASKTAIKTGQPADIECMGGIRLYAAPIRVGDEIVGAINFGYGEPPRDEKKLRELATTYKVSYEELLDHAMQYESRPPYIVDLAKQRLMASARMIGEIIKRKQAEEALRKSEEMMFSSQSVAHICSYSTNLNVNELDKSVWVCSPEFYRIFGIDETYPHTIAGWTGFIHPDHREEMAAYHEYVIKNRISFNHEYKIIRVNDGAERWVHGTGELVYDAQGKPVRMYGAIQDITERKLAEDALQKSEAIKNKMVSNIGDVIVIIDKDGFNRYKSPNSEKWFGWKPEEVVGNSTWDNVHPDDLEASQKFLQSLVGEANACGTTELRYRKKDGSYCPIEITVANLLHDPNIQGFLGNYHNISERKKIEQELILAKEKAEENEEKFRSIVKSSPSAIYLYHLENDDRLVLIDANPSAERITGISHQALIGKTLEEAFPNLVHTEVPEMYRKIARRQIDNQSFEMPYNDGRFTGYYSVKVYATQTNSIAVDFIDISGKKKLELDLIAAKDKAEESEKNIRKHKAEIEFHSERLESLLRISQYNTNSIQELLDFALSEAINLTASKIGYIYFYNEEKSKFILNTWSKDVMKECGVINPQTNYDLDKTGCWGEAVRQRKPVVINDYQAENPHKKGLPEGHVRLSKFLTIPVIFENKIVAVAGLANKETDYNNDDVRQLTLLMDNVWKISERIQLIENLKVAKEKAEESDRLKTAFLQNMSHEIRTPMNAIMGFSELLVKNYNNKPKLEKFSEIINRRCNDLLDIINDILDIAKIESGQLTVIQEECNLNVLFDELKTFFTEHQKRIGKQHIAFNLHAFCEPSDTLVVTDKVKLKQIFINLISNAFKFTETGKIEGGCKFDENKNLLFFVSDTGIGIPSDKQQLIFERFAQVEHSSNRLYGGTGLGLSIVKGLVNLLGGEMFLESEIGKGSIFSFVIPYIKSYEIQPETMVSDERQDYSFGNKTILIVEDDIYNAEYLNEILSDKGLTILNTIYGRESVEIATNQAVDLVLMDIRLPDMDGYEATRQIKKQRPHLKIIAQTAYASQDEAIKAIESGCVDYISKPAKQELLFEMINKHLV